MPPKVKICGITNEEDAVAAVRAGADAIGFIFVESSPRYIAPLEAALIISSLPPFVTPIGVFANNPAEYVKRIVQESGIRCIQFHGEETPDEICGYDVPVYKAFRVDSAFEPFTLQEYRCKTFLLDTYVNGMLGGTGRSFDWTLAVAAKAYGAIILSGGLSPENIVAAIKTVRPYAVDINSGIEVYPGKKDPAKLNALFDAIHTM